MTIRILILSFILLSVSSCSLETDPIVVTSINNTPEISLLKEVRKNGVTINTYTYQDSILLSSTILGTNTITTQYSYQGDTILSDQLIDGILTSKRKYYHTSESEGIRERRTATGEISDIRTYSFNGSDCGYQSFVTVDPLGDQTNAGNFTFSNGFCDGSFRSFDASGNLEESDSFLNDGKPAANSSTILPFFQVSKKYNIVSFVKVVDEQIDSSRSYSAEFDYNIDNYPEEEIRTYFDGTIEEYLYIYE